MKRLLCLILALVMCLGLFACGDEPAQDETEISVDTPADVVTNAEETEEEEEEPPVDPATVWD